MENPNKRPALFLRPSWRRIAEIVLVALVALVIARFLYIHGGQVFGTDSLLYLDTGLRGQEDPFILNRYSHVYLFRLFTYLAPTTLEGLRIYSGFVGGLSAILVYACARALSEKSTPVNGLLAAGLFLGLPMVVERILAPTVDTSVMLLMLGLLTVYIGSTRAHPARSWPMILFGALFFLALRTKETAIVAGILLVGFGFEAERAFSFRIWLRSMGYVLAGMALGALLTVLGNAIVLGSPLFGFRPSDLLEYRQRWSETLGSAEGSGTSFQSLVLAAAAGIPFVLYVAAGFLARDRHPLRVRLIWLLPLALAGMLILFSTRGNWAIVPRGFLPGFAFLSVLGSQLVVLHTPVKAPRRDMLIAVAGSLLGIAILGGIGLLVKGDRAYEIYFLAVYAPIMLCSILGVLFLAREGQAANLAILILLLPLSLYPVRLTLGQVATRPAVLTDNARFQILLPYKEWFKDPDPVKLYVTRSALPVLAIEANLDELSSLINVALDMQTRRDQVALGTPDAELVAALIRGEYSHLLITASEWDWLRTEPQDRPEWRRQYEAFREPGQRFVVLRRIEGESPE